MAYPAFRKPGVWRSTRRGCGNMLPESLNKREEFRVKSLKVEGVEGKTGTVHN
jgi:hypothetical protein